MKKYFLLFFSLLNLCINAQIFKNINKTNDTSKTIIAAIDSLRFNSNGEELQMLLDDGTLITHKLTEIDSITFFFDKNLTNHSCGEPEIHNPGLSYGSMSDQEGNNYKTIQIGNQVWMAEDLNTSIYRNRDTIQKFLDVFPNTEHLYLENGAWQYKLIDSTYECPFGKVYNWYAVTDMRGLCPIGWHVPSDAEWNNLIGYLDPFFYDPGSEDIQSYYAGGAMKSMGSNFWAFPNNDDSNESGFSALPGGAFNPDFWGGWWSFSQKSRWDAWLRNLEYNNGSVKRSYNSKTTPNSVRCLKDNAQNIQCLSPQVIFPVRTGLTKAKISWLAPPSVFQYNLKFRITGSNSWTDLILGGIASDTTLENLLPSTEYEFLLRTKCLNDPEIFSSDSPIVKFSTAKPGEIIELGCDDAIHDGILIKGIEAIDVSTTLPYWGGGGGFFNQQTIASIGVVGLTATLKAGNFADGKGEFLIVITGNPLDTGTARFNLLIGGKKCTLTRTVGQTGISAHSCGTDSVHNPKRNYGSLTDQQGNVYRTVIIGKQEWMAENLKTSIYRNGEVIPNVKDSVDWINLKSGAWCNYANSIENDCPYGKLYNWYAVSDPRYLCPAGWHVPDESDWDILTASLGGRFVELGPGGVPIGGKLKSNTIWEQPNEEATNESGFSALGSGARSDVMFGSLNLLGRWWSATEYYDGSWYRELFNQSIDFGKNHSYKSEGHAVRCVKD